MRHHIQAATVAYFFLVFQTVEAGPLKWAARDIARRAAENVLENSPPATDSNGIPRPIFTTLTGVNVSIPGLLPTTTTTTTSMKAESSDYSGSLTVVPAMLPTQTTPGTVVPTTTSSNSIANGTDSLSSTTGLGSSRLTTPTSIVSTTPGTTSLTTSSTVTGGATKPTLTSIFRFPGNATRGPQQTKNESKQSPCGLPSGTLPDSTTSSASNSSCGSSTTQSTSALATTVTTTPTATLPGTTFSSSGTSIQSDGSPNVLPTTTAASGITQTTLSVPSTHVLATIPEATTTSPSSSTGPQPVVTFTPTGTPDANVPTAIAGFPTATTSVASATYAGNVAQAKALNKIYSTLMPQSACSGTQIACIQGKMAQCTNGAFVLTACAANEKCYALPMTNTQGAKIACSNPEEAIKILGPAGEGGTSTTSTTTDEVPTTFRTKAKKPALTHTRFVTVTEVSSTAPGQSTVQSDPATLVSATTERPPGPTTSTSTSSSTSSSSSSSSPPPPPRSTINQPSRIVITQTFNKPTQTTTSTTTSGLLELIPVELTALSAPTPPITAPIPVAAKPAASNAVVLDGTDPATATSDGAPTVSACFAATVTRMEKETVTVTATLFMPMSS